MSTIELRDGGLTIRLSLVEKMCALHASVHADQSQVLRAFSVNDPWDLLRGLRMPGLGVPGMVALGTWRWRRAEGSGRDFVVVRGHGPGVVVDLRDHEFDRLLLSVDQPAELTGVLG